MIQSIEPIVIAGPVLPGVFLYQAKQHCRIDHEDEDNVIDGYIATATKHFEMRTGRTVFDTTREMIYERFPSGCPILLPFGFPLIEVVSIKYTDSDGVETTLDSDLYVSDVYGRILPTYGESWPTFTAAPLSPIKIRYRAGVDSVSPQIFPEEGIQHCILEMVGSMYMNREHMVTVERGSTEGFLESPFVKGLLEHYRVKYAV